MAQIQNRRKKKNSTLYSIELDVKNLIVLCLLAAFTGITIFYLGMLFGKATRDPNLGLVEDKRQTDDGTKPDVKKEIPKNLKIFDIRDQDKSLNNFKKDFDALSKKSDRLIDKEEEAQKAEEKLAAQAKRITSAPAQKSPAREWPERKSKTARLDSGEIYTLQVLATINKNKSNVITKQLIQKGFDAYVITDRVDNKTLYKVRVGRKGKGSIRSLKPRLDRVVAGMGVKTRLIKIK